MRKTMRIITLALAAMLLGCQTLPPRTGSVADNISKSLAETQTALPPALSQPATPPAEVSNALLPPMNVQLFGVARPEIERRFDITVNRVPVQTFFMSLVKDTPYNMVTPPNLEGSISLSMKNVTIKEVMETVRNVYGYEYREFANGYEVLGSALQSRVFKIDYLNVKRSSASQVRVSSGQVSGKSKSEDGEAGSRTETISGSEVQTQTESDFWSELKLALGAIVGVQDGRQVVISPQSGIIVVRALPAEIRGVEEYLATTQNIIQRQVILEAKILEVELSDGFQSGINWAILGKKGADRVVAGQFGASSFPNTGFSNLRGQTDALNPADFESGVRSDVASAFGGMFAMSLDIGDFTGFIEFLETQGDVHVLSSPRVSTVNNQKAVIKVGTDEFFVTDVDTQTTTSTVSATDQSIDVELTPFFSGVALDVLPQISEDGVVTLHIHPSVSEVSERIKEINLTATNAMSVPLAVSTIRESDSIVRARNGQVVVIGGLMQNQTQDINQSVPLLGELPLVGGLFRNKQQITTKSELVILLRPIVVDNDKVWQDHLQQTSNTFDSLNKLGKHPGGKGD